MTHTLFTLLMSIFGTSFLVGEPGPASAEPQTRIEIRISPAVDFHFHARVIAGKPAGDSKTGAYGGVVAAMRKLGDQLGSHMLAWGPVEGTLYGCDTVADIRKSYADLPELFQPRVSGPDPTIPLRKLALTVADEMVKTELNFREFVWPAHKATLEHDAERIAHDFKPKEAKCIAYMLEHLGIKDPKTTVPVYLVGDAPFPGAFTFRRRGTGAVCFIASPDRNAAGSLLYETILHEATHALDVASDGKSVFGTLRKTLAKEGLSTRNQLFRDVPHTLMFIHAGETIRRIVDPMHVHYGDAAGYYKKVPLATRVIRPVWIDYLDGRITRDAAINKIIDDIMIEVD